MSWHFLSSSDSSDISDSIDSIDSSYSSDRCNKSDSSDRSNVCYDNLGTDSWYGLHPQNTENRTKIYDIYIHYYLTKVDVSSNWPYASLASI